MSAACVATPTPVPDQKFDLNVNSRREKAVEIGFRLHELKWKSLLIVSPRGCGGTTFAKQFQEHAQIHDVGTTSRNTSLDVLPVVTVVQYLHDIQKSDQDKYDMIAIHIDLVRRMRVSKHDLYPNLDLNGETPFSFFVTDQRTGQAWVEQAAMGLKR